MRLLLEANLLCGRNTKESGWKARNVRCEFVRNPERAHSYPFKIGLQVQEFLQAALLHTMLLDIAARRFLQLPQGFKEIEAQFVAQVDSKLTYDEAWGYLSKYQAVFQESALQTALIALNSHWDWYLRKLRTFIVFAREKLRSPSFGKDEDKKLAKVDYLPMPDQLEVLKQVLTIELELSEQDESELCEMSLVRNLGLHNRWEVDDRYLERSSRAGYEFGEIRVVEIAELSRWHSLLIHLINKSTSKVAQDYAAAPEYPASAKLPPA